MDQNTCKLWSATYFKIPKSRLSISLNKAQHFPYLATYFKIPKSILGNLFRNFQIQVIHFFKEGSTFSILGPNWNWAVQGREGEGVQGQRDEECGQQGRHRSEDRGGHQGEDRGDEQERGEQQGGGHSVPSLPLLRYQAWGNEHKCHKWQKLYCPLYTRCTRTTVLSLEHKWAWRNRKEGFRWFLLIPTSGICVLDLCCYLKDSK